MLCIEIRLSNKFLFNVYCIRRLLETDMDANLITRDSVLGLYLRRLLLTFHELRFSQVLNSYHLNMIACVG